MSITYTVTQINNNVDNILQTKFENISIEGEISSLNISPNGHAYYTLKDDKSELSCVMFKLAYNKYKNNISVGSSAIVIGILSIYKPKGNFQLKVTSVNVSGKGKFWKNFEELKNKLLNEGLFDNKYKLTIPMYIKKIVIVTSLNGVVKDDIIKIIKKRSTYQKISIYPVTVQGSSAAIQISNAINDINQSIESDIIIIARGGGSIEDLSPFNDEILARSIFTSKIPIISAIGHESDFTISDFVSDYRASTPSDAAKLVSINQKDILQLLDEINIRICNRVKQEIDNYKETLFRIKNKKVLQDPLEPIKIIKSKILEIFKYLNIIINLKVNNLKDKIGLYNSNLINLNPMNVIDRGYSLLLTDKKKSISLIKDVKIGDTISSIIRDGELKLEVTEKHGKEKEE